MFEKARTAIANRLMPSSNRSNTAREKKSSGTFFSGGSFLAESIIGRSYLSATEAMRFYRESDAVSTAVDMIADEVEHIKPVIRMPDGKLTNDHPILRLLLSPNKFQFYSQFIGNLSRHHLLTNEMYIYAGGVVSTPPIEISAPKPQCISATEAEDTFPHSFLVSQGLGSANYVRTEWKDRVRYYSGSMRELYPMFGFSSGSDETRADSKLLSAMKSVNQQVQGMVHNVSLLENGARPSLIVNFKDNINEDEARARKQFLQEQIGGAENSGGIIATFAADMDIKEAGISNKDMDYQNLDNIARNAIYLRYKIPLPLVSLDASTFNNMSQAVFHLYDRAVLPEADKIFQALTHLLMPRFGLDPAETWITYDPETIDALRGRTLEELKTRKELNLETTNELRDSLSGREPIEGGDVLYQNASLVPVGTDMFTDDNVDTEEEVSRLTGRDE